MPKSPILSNETTTYMKKITLNETDLMKIVKRVLNEQKDRQLDEDEIDILYFIFERELKPPFKKGEQAHKGVNQYYNRNDEEIGYLYSDQYYDRDGEFIGQLYSLRKTFSIIYDPFWINIEHKVCQVFQFSYETGEWWNAIEPHLKSWLEDQLNIKLNVVE